MRQAPRWMQRCGLEWLRRFVSSVWLALFYFINSDINQQSSKMKHTEPKMTANAAESCFGRPIEMCREA